MKISKLLYALLGCVFVGNANAADITIFYSPTCPHCHHAREFIGSTLIYEYGDLKVTEVNVMDPDNRQVFGDALKKCEYTSGGVPVLVIGEKCFQGFADVMQDDVRAAIEVDLTDEQKTAAANNKSEMAKNKESFVASHKDRESAISEYVVAKKKLTKTSFDPTIWMFVVLGLMLLGLIVVVVKKQK